MSLLDLVGMKDLLASDGAKRRRAIDAMEALDKVCNGQSLLMHQIDYIYCWNDSVLFLSYIDMPMPRTMSAIVEEVSRVKSTIDTECHVGSFVVMVKGMSFLPNGMEFRAPVHQGGAGDPVYHYVRASSMAFANCETIVKKFRNDHHDWYIDQRIRDGMEEAYQNKLTERGEFRAFPGMETRKVYTADAYLHQEAARL